MTVYHEHHLVPRHAGGTDDPSNLIKVTVEEHAELHFARYLQYGELGDWLAAFALSGQITGAEAAQAARKDWMSHNASRIGAIGGKAPASEKAKAIAAGLAAELGKKPWWTNGERNTRSWECPGEGWVKGRKFRVTNVARTVCPDCGMSIIPSNLARHVQSAHTPH